MPKTGRCNWADIIMRALKNLGGEAHLSAIYQELSKFPEAQEKVNLCRSRTPGGKVDIQAQVRVLLSAGRDPRFEKTDRRGYWRLRTVAEGQTALPIAYVDTTGGSGAYAQSTTPRTFTIPARYKDRSLRILKLMCRLNKPGGWAQKELARELGLDINAVNKVVNFMKTEGLLKVVAGKGKTQNPFRYAPVDGVLEDRVINPLRERKRLEEMNQDVGKRGPGEQG